MDKTLDDIMGEMEDEYMACVEEDRPALLARVSRAILAEDD